MEKLYWKGRKIKNAVLFKIKAFFHKRRDELESKKDDLLFEKNVVKEVIKAFIKNICIIALILFLEQILVSEKCDGIFPYGLQKWIIKTNALVVEDRSLLTDVLSAIVGVAGIFLGLYCANIMSMYAEKYANAPQSISRLFENDIVSNKCIKAITNYLIFSVVVLFLQIIQIDIGIIMLIVLGVKALKIIVSFAFMSRRTYQFSDMYYVTNAVYKEIYRNLLHLNKGKMFTHDKNFQKYYKKQVKKCVGILAEINNYNLEKEEKISASVESFMKHNVALIYTYWQEKGKISYDSYWYDDKVVYKKWYSASDTEIEMALKTGTLLGYNTEKNYLWLEEDIEQINDNGLQYLINQKSFAGLIRWLGTLENLSERAVESGNVVYYVDYLYKIQKKLQNTIGKEKFSLEEEMALAEHIVVGYLGVLVGVRKYIEKWSEESCFCDVKLFERKSWKNPNRFYNYFDVNKIYDGVKAEIRLEKHRITPEWYINQVVAKLLADNLADLLHYGNEELCKAQQEMYRDRALQKRTCKTAEDLEFFEASEDDYRERLEQIKLQKKDNRKKLKAVERCLERDGSLGEAELEYRIPVGDMVDMEEVEKDEVPGNPYRVQEDVEVENTVLDDAVEADVITEPKFESVVDDELETEVETFAETAVTGLKTVGKTAVTNAESVVKTDIDVMAESIESGMQNDDIRQIYYRRRLTVEIWSILPGLSCLTR